MSRHYYLISDTTPRPCISAKRPVIPYPVAGVVPIHFAVRDPEAAEFDPDLGLAAVPYTWGRGNATATRVIQSTLVNRL